MTREGNNNEKRDKRPTSRRARPSAAAVTASPRLTAAGSMASAEEQPAAVEPAAAEAEAGGKGGKPAAAAPRAKPMPKPERATLDAELAKHAATQERHQARLAELDAQIKEKNASRKAVSGDAGSSSNRARLVELNAAFKARMVRACRACARARRRNAFAALCSPACRLGPDGPVAVALSLSALLQDEKNALREELTASDAARDRARDELKAARGALKFRTPEDVGAEIQRLEHLMSHTTMPLNEEKRLMTEIKALSKSRDEVKAHGDREAKLAGNQDARASLVERLRAKDAEITAVKADRTAVQAALAAVRAKEDAHVAGLPALHEERNKIWEALCAARDAGRKTRDAFKAQEDAWWSNERVWRTQQRDEKQKRRVPGAPRGRQSIALCTSSFLPGPARGFALVGTRTRR